MRHLPAVNLRALCAFIVLLTGLATSPTARAQSGPVSDDFHSTTLNTSLWTVVNPVGNGTVSLNGTDAVLSVPAGTPHDLWTGGNQTVRILQTTSVTDFQVDVKFDSIPTLGNQDQGVIVQTDANNYLRFDVYSSSSSQQYMFAASFVNNSPTVQADVAISGAKAPFWIRVNRTGSVWTESWSVDGTNFTQAASFSYSLVVNQMGPYAGNCCGTSSPAFTSYVDYFFNSASPISPADGGMWNGTTAPVISSVSATSVTSTGATISWTTNQFSSSRVDYGTTTSYGTALSNSTSVLSHSITLTSLTCNTPYHYKVSSTDTNGFTGSSGDNTFTTGSCGSSSGPTSDDFHSTSLNTSLWTVVNPVGDGTVSLNGSDAVLSVPAGTPHDLWTGGNQTVRILQTTSVTDFQVDVKFDSIPTLGNQDQGVIVQTDANNYLRFDVYSSSSSQQYMFAASFVNNSPTVQADVAISGAKAPFWIRVNRTGSVWTESWSVDGTNFTQAASFSYSLVVNQMGPYAGNCCGTSSPAFTSYVDYFFNSASPISPADGGMWNGTTAPVISSVSATSVTSTGATISWTTNQFSSSRVDYGTTTSYGTALSNSTSVLSHSITLTSLTCNTPYHYKVSSTDTNGFTGSSGDNTFTTGSCGSSSGPTSDDFHSTSLNTSLWTVVNPVGDGTVSLNGTDAVLSVPAGTPHDLWTGGNQTVRILQTTSVTDFQVDVKFDSIPTLGNQDQGVIVQTDANNYLRFDVYSSSSSQQYMFAASFVNNSPTVQADVAISGAKAPFWIRVNRTGSVWTESWSVDGTNFTQAASFSYSLVVNQMGPYAGNCCGTSSPAFTSYVDYFFNSASPISPADGGMWNGTTAPVISSVSATSVTSTGATISWTTNQFSSSRVDYGTTTSYGTALSNSTSVLSHSITLTSLTCNTPYHYKVSSTDTNGFTGSSGDNTFTTGSCGSSSGPTSDDFHSTSLNTSLWTVVNPVGDGTVSLNGTNLLLSLPAGTPHDVYLSDPGLRVMQTVSNSNFDVAVKFDSAPTAPYQEQGIIIQQDANNWLRFDFFRDAYYTNVFAMIFANGAPTTANDVNLDGSARLVAAEYNMAGTLAPFWLRITRSGSSFTESWSIDGVNYTVATTLTSSMVVNQMGPFVGNCCGSSSPAITESVDYFFNLNSPISPSDGGANIPFITPFPADPPITSSYPVISVWYGDNQTFGQNGKPQTWVNVLGSVYGTNPISSLSYTLNGGSSQPLSIGVDRNNGSPRLPEPGNFNVEIAYSSLNVGFNTLTITATDNQGHKTTHTVTITYVNGTPCTLPCTIDWSKANNNIQSVAQIVDGKWEIQPDGTVRTLQIGYDRLLAIGDMSWTNYEVTVPITVHARYIPYFGIGVITGWQGHTASPCQQLSSGSWVSATNCQPNYGHPFYGLAWWINQYYNSYTTEEIYANSPSYDETPLIDTPRVLTLGTPYMFKFSVQRNSPNGTHYRFKIWQVGTTEPTTWDEVVDDSDTTLGSIVLGTFQGDVSYGTVTITAPE